MSSKDIKMIRGQIRQIVKEMLPEALASELVLRMGKDLTALIVDRLNKIDERQKDIQNIMIRNSIPKEPNKTD